MSEEDFILGFLRVFCVSVFWGLFVFMCSEKFYMFVVVSFLVLFVG